MYLKWSEQTITDFSDANINRMYESGFLFTREHKGSMYQTRSLRIDLSKFELSSENRRVLKKTDDIGLMTYDLPYEKYSWEIGKMGKEFYQTKFGEKTFSANKIKELLTEKHNFNKLFIYDNKQEAVGYCICFETDKILHYSYPFYVLHHTSYVISPNLGLGMMLHAIIYAKEAGHVKLPDGRPAASKKNIYFGSGQDAKAKYKLQFAGLEWFDGTNWDRDINKLKNI